MNGDETAQVELARAISVIREQLSLAIEEGKDSPVAFRAGPVELDFDVSFTQTTGPEAGIRVWVVSLGFKAERARASSNRLKVTLTPVDREGSDRLIGSVAAQ
jgi:hypothetical protein